MKFLLTFLFFSLPHFVLAQAELPTCTNCLDSTLKVFWSADLPVLYEKGEKVITHHTLNLSRPTEGLLFVGSGDSVEVEILNKVTQEVSTIHLGRAAAPEDLVHPFARFFYPLKLDSGRYAFKLRTQSVPHLPYLHTLSLVQNASIEELQAKLSNNGFYNNILTWLFCIFSGLFCVFAFINTYGFKNRYFSSYQWYTLTIFLFALFHVDYFSQKMFFFGEYILGYGLVTIFLQQLIFATYNEFIVDFMDLKSTDLLTFKILKAEQLFHFALAIVLPLALYITRDYQWMLGSLSLVNLSTGILGFWAITRLILYMKSRLKWYIILGAIFLSGSAVVELLLTKFYGANFSRDFYSATWNGLTAFNVFQFGAMLDIALFFLAINHKTSKAEKEKLAFQERIATQLRENEKLQFEVNELLQKEVDVQKSLREKERISLEKTEAESKLRLAQLKSIQLQMNPHYFFNSLNSVNDFLITKSPREASEYLSKYAKLMRSVLRNSDSAFTSIGEEVEHLNTYLSLEQLRFENSFSFHFYMPNEDEFQDREIPIMLIQPLLENAVWHGMQKISYPGVIDIIFEKQDTGFSVIIRDNGSGLNAQGSKKLHRSKGLRLIQDKLAVINELPDYNVAFSIGNRKDGKSGVEAIYVFN